MLNFQEFFKSSSLEKNCFLFILLSPVFFFLFHFSFLNKFSLWMDELAVWQIATSLQVDFVYQPLVFHIIHFIIDIFGSDAEWVLRLLSALAGSFIPLAGYFLSRSLANFPTALLTFSFLASSPIVIANSQDAKNYSLLILFSILTCYFMVQWESKREKLAYLFSFISLSFCLQILARVHYFGLCLAFLLGLSFLFFYFNKKKLLTGTIIFNLLALTPVIKSLVTSATTIHSIGFWIPPIDDLSETLIHLFSHFLLGYRASNSLLIILLPLSALFMVLSIANKKIKHKELKRNLLILCWFVIPIICSVIISYILFPIFHNYYLLISLFPLLFLISNGLDALLSYKPKFKKVTLPLLCALIFFGQWQFYINNHQRIPIVYLKVHHSWRAPVSYINRIISSPRDILLTCSYRHSTVDYYLRRHQKLSLEKITRFEVCDRESLNKAQIKANSFDTIIFYWNNKVPEESFLKELSSLYKLDHVSKFKRAQVSIYKPF